MHMDKGVGGLKNWAIFMGVICVSSLLILIEILALAS